MVFQSYRIYTKFPNFPFKMKFWVKRGFPEPPLYPPLKRYYYAEHTFSDHVELLRAVSWHTLSFRRVAQLAFYVNLHRAIIGPSATLTGRWRPDIDLRRMLTGWAQKRTRSLLKVAYSSKTDILLSKNVLINWYTVLIQSYNVAPDSL